MTAKQQLQQLKCTQCGGSIEIRGGHNVRSIVCKYCGACLDSKKEFAVLHQFLHQRKPFMPLKIGLRGKLKGINFVVIGVLQYEQREAGEVYRWLEYLLFSHTHGYVYLCYEDGHWVMMHEVKDIPETEVDVVMPRKSKFEVRGKTFKVFECAAAKLTYVEGELTWQAKQNEKISYLDAVCPPYLYSIERRTSEREYFWGEYLSAAEISEAFKVECIQPSTVFSCQPFICSPLLEAISKGALIASLFSLLMYFFISTDGSRVAAQAFGKEVFSDGAVSEEFIIDDPEALYGVTVRAPHLENSWSYFDLRLLNAQQTEEFCTIPLEVSYYSGVEGGEHWSEGSREETSYFQLPEAGNYRLEIEGEGNRGETNQSRPDFFLPQTAFEIRKGVRLGHHTLAWFFISLLIAAPYFVRLYMFENKRWNDDEEDDD
jgi:hypothetical protein